MAGAKERIPLNAEENPVIRSIVGEPSVLETLLVRKISLLQIEGRFVNGEPDIKKPILFVSSPLPGPVVEYALQSLVNRKKRAKKPFGTMLIVHPKDFDEIITRYSEGSLRTTLVNLYSQ